MILERAVYGVLAAMFWLWALASIRSGQTLITFSTVKRSDDPLMFWVGVILTFLIGVGLAWLVISPEPLGWPYRR